MNSHETHITVQVQKMAFTLAGVKTLFEKLNYWGLSLVNQ